MMPLVNVAFAFALAINGQNPSVTKAPKSVAIGELLVTVSRVWLPPNAWVDYKSDRFRLVVVEVTVKNVSKRISHATFTPSLKVKPDYTYSGSLEVGHQIGVKAPSLYQLLPGEESTGGYVFEVRKGTTAVALILNSFPTQSIIDLTGVEQSERPQPSRPDAK